jgi:proteasome lid subunit RPN8/RPN11
MWGRASALQNIRVQETTLDRFGLAIRAHVLRAVAAHARDAWPQECCGLLLGTAGSIDAAYRARNEHAEPVTRYLVRPDDHFAALRLARAQALEVVGGYHSHPAGRPRPSASDRDQAHAAGFIYLIAGARRLRRTRFVRRRCAGRGGAFHRSARRRSERRRVRSIEAQGHWVAAWRLVEGNFVQVPLVRLP